LTEVFAAVLDHAACGGLAQFVARRWLEVARRRGQLSPDGLLLLELLSSGEWVSRVLTRY